MRASCWVVLPLVIILGVNALAAAAEAGDAKVRETVTRSLGFLEKEGVAWMQERGCASCHNTTFLVWSHNEAARRGVPVDAAKVEAWTNWALVNGLARKDGGGLDTMYQLVLARDANSSWRRKPSRNNKTVDPFENLWESILAAQEPDGFWKPGGQLTSPPEVTTRWALLALESRDTTAAQGAVGALAEQVKRTDAAVGPAREKALTWLAKAPPAASTEALALRLLTAYRSGSPGAGKAHLDELLARQRPDGGWSYTAGGAESDAFATGQALYALTWPGIDLNGSHPSLSRARAFLLRTQRPDGSWFVSTRSIHPVTKAKTEGTDQVYTYWGSAWAAIGLARTLPMAR
jgi:hypothetical protein